MRILTLLSFILFTTSSWSAQCHLYEIKGQVVRTNDVIHLVVNENTRVENKLLASKEAVPRLIPYFGKTVKGEFVFKSQVKRGETILKVVSIEDDIPDPLNQKNHSFIKELKVVPCP